MSMHYIENTGGWKVGDTLYTKKKVPYVAFKPSDDLLAMYRNFDDMRDLLKASTLKLHVTRVMDDGSLECEEVAQ